MLLSQMYAITFAETATKEISDIKIQTILSHFGYRLAQRTIRIEIRKIILKNLKIRSIEKFIRTLDQGMKNLNERSQNHHRSNNSFIHLESKHD